MTHGGKDWGTSGPLSTLYTLEDMAELAARLGSVVTHDRRGNVIWIDDFQSGVEKWYHTPAFGASFTWSAAKPYHGGFSARLQTGNTEYDEAKIDMTRPFPVLSRMGFEFAFSCNQYLTHVQLSAYLADGTNMHRARIRWVSATKTWQYRDSRYAWKDLTPIHNLPMGETNFAIVKLVADYSAEEYLRLIANNISYDLSGEGYSKLGSGLGPYIYLEYVVETNADYSAVLNLGYFILTTNEP